MQTYTVYEKRVASANVEERAGDLVFVKEGFAFWAFIAPFFWFLFNRLWWGLALYLVLTIGLSIALTLLSAGEEALSWGSIFLNLIFAFEARDIQRSTLERKGYVIKGVVSGRNLAECERRYLQEWLPQVKRESDRDAALTAGAPAGTTPASSSGVPVIGMFPAHGG